MEITSANKDGETWTRGKDTNSGASIISFVWYISRDSYASYPLHVDKYLSAKEPLYMQLKVSCDNCYENIVPNNWVSNK